MKPFNLVVTRDGRKVLQIAHFPAAPDEHGVLVLVEGSSGIQKYRSTGIAHGYLNNDLVMAPKQVMKYVNIYKDSSGRTYMGAWLHSTPEAAKRDASANAIHIAVPVTYEE